MSEIVRVQIPDGEDWRTIAQLESRHAAHYIEQLRSDMFSDRVQREIDLAKSPLVKEDLIDFQEQLNIADFSNLFRTIPTWTPAIQ